MELCDRRDEIWRSDYRFANASFDQPLKARLVEEVGIGEEDLSNKEGNFEKEEIIRKVVGEKGLTH